MTCALRSIPFINSYVTERNITNENLADSYCDNKLDGDMFPLTYQIIDKYQQKYEELVAKIKRTNCHTKCF